MGRRLLYIDPDPTIRLLVRKALKPAGFTVLEAESPAAARRLAAQTRPDIVLIDVDVAGMSPPDLIEALRRWPGTEAAVLLATTADNRPAHVERTLGCGFTAVLTKPLDIDTLAPALRSHLPESEDEVRGIAAVESGRVAEIRPRWRRNLIPLTENLVRTVSVADGRLALLTGEGDAIMLVAAAHSLRPHLDAPPIGLLVPLASVPWLRPALTSRETVLVDAATVGASPLISGGSTAALVVPVAAGEKTYGVIVLGERRRRAFAFPPAQVAESLAQAGRIAAVLGEFDRLDESVRLKRHELERHVINATQTLAAGRPLEPAGAKEIEGLVRIGLELARRLGLSEGDTAVLGQAIEVHDVGRMWIEAAVLPHVALPPDNLAAVLAGHEQQTLEILDGLGWPKPVLELVRANKVPGDGDDREQPGPAGRIMAVVTAYQSLIRSSGPNGRTLTAPEALAEIGREAGKRFDPEVVGLLAGLISEDSNRTA